MGRTACTEPQCLYSRAIPLPSPRAVRPVRSLCVCTRVHFTGWTVPGSNPGRRRDFPHLTKPALGAHPASCTMGTGSFPAVKSGRGVTLNPHPPLVPWSRKSRAILLLSLRAVRPVQSLSAVELYLYSPYGPYGLYRASVPVQGCTLPLPAY
jgi:hypothetical protein